MTTPEEQAATMRANIAEKTGKPLADWLAILAAAGLEKHGQRVALLKADHGVSHGFANLIAHDFAAQSAPAEIDLVAQQYGGAKAGLRPIYDAVIALVQGFGDDVELAPKKAYVSLRRSKQFGLIQPSTKSRVDLGLALKGIEPEGRLETSGSFNAMVSHRIKLSSPDDVDDQVAAWLKRAYELA